MNYIKQAFDTLGITLDRNRIRQMQTMEIHFRLRGTNILTFNGMLLGVHPIAFKTPDRNAFFSIFGIEEKQVSDLIRKIPTIDRSHNVESDPFNLFAFWLMHSAFLYIEDPRVRHNFQMSVCKYYHYKLFTSIVNNLFRVGAIEGVMQAVINNLTNKSDITRYESWGNVIDDRCTKILDPESKYYKPMQLATPDEAFKRLLSGSQTSLRNKMVIVAQKYYEAYNNGDRVGYASSTSEDADGEKIIAQTASVIDSTMADLVSDVLTLNTWLNETDIKLVAGSYSALTPNMLRLMLTQFSEEAVYQMSKRTFDKTITKRGEKGTLYVGIRALLFEMVRSSIRFCVFKGINPARKAECLDALRSVYSSSRNLDQDIIDIKNSVTVIIREMRLDYSETAVLALRLALVQYILVRMYRKL